MGLVSSSYYWHRWKLGYRVLMLSCELSNFCSAVCSHHKGNLSKPLQNLSISAVQGQEIAHLVIETLSKKKM